MSRRADEAFEALSRAASDTTPPCTGDGRFVMDAHELHRDEVAFLAARVCWPCPLRALCRAYGDTAKPAAGIWGGRVHRAGRAASSDNTPIDDAATAIADTAGELNQ